MNLATLNEVACRSYLSDHPVPNSPDQLAVLAVGDEVEVIGELYGAGQLLQDVYAEAFTAQFSVWFVVTHNTGNKEENKRLNLSHAL